MVKVYTSPTCAYCPMVKNYLKRLGIDFIEKDITNPADAADYQDEVGSQGYQTVPAVVLGDQIIVGYQPRALASLRAS